MQRKPTKVKKDPSKDDGDSSASGPEERLREKGIYYITGDIDEGSTLEIQQDILLKHLDDNWKDDVQIIINSGGGCVDEAWALVDLLDWIRMDVRTTGMGQCCSAAACLLACGTPGKRIITMNTSILVHGASMGVHGNIQQIAASSKMAELEHEKDVKFWLKHSKYNTPEEVVNKFLNGIDQWIGAEEAKKHGIVDHLIGYQSSPVTKKTRTKKKPE